jgi:DNA-binding LacI/PurR family transcriptional regulator
MLKIEKNHPQAYFEQVKELLRTNILSGRYKADALIPDERSLATELRISRMTVRRAILELTGEGLLTRIRGRGTFVRGSFAPQRKKQRGSVALVTGFNRLAPNTFFYYRLMQGIYEGAEREGISLILRQLTTRDENYVAALRRDSSLKGLIVVGVDDVNFIQRLTDIKMPTVLVDTVPPDPPLFDEVNHRCESSVCTAVRSLLHLGHRRIGLLTIENPGQFTRERESGYRNALQSYNVPVRDEFIYRVNFSEPAAYGEARKMLQSPDRPTALFCIADELALAAIAAAKDHGLKVPRDLSVIGYGDMGHFSSPALSTVRIPVEQMGLAAAQMLSRRFDNPCAPMERMLLDTEFVTRASCDCPGQMNSILSK